MHEDTPEVWRPILGYDGFYEVSSLGRIRSLPRKGLNGVRGGKILALFAGAGGYLFVNVSVNGVAAKYPVHRAVCEAWHDARPDGMMVRHLDGDKLNNTPGNLAWGTASENMQDCLRHGTHHFAAKTHCPQGHPYEGGNLIMESGKYRRCRQCTQETDRRRKAPRASEIYEQRKLREASLSPEKQADLKERRRQAIAKVKAGKRAEVAAERAAAGLPPPMKNSLKTHCKRGHPLSGDNLRVNPKGHRRCRACAAMTDTELRERQKQAKTTAA